MIAKEIGELSGKRFAAEVQGAIGKSKATIVTRSRLHAARYKLAVDRFLAERGYPQGRHTAGRGRKDEMCAAQDDHRQWRRL